jgi:phosphomevalonate kinase
MNDTDKQTIMANFKSWQQEKAQSKECSDHMKEYVEETAKDVLVENPENKEEMKKAKKIIKNLFNYLDREDKNDSTPQKLVQLIDELEK